MLAPMLFDVLIPNIMLFIAQITIKPKTSRYIIMGFPNIHPPKNPVPNDFPQGDGVGVCGFIVI